MQLLEGGGALAPGQSLFTGPVQRPSLFGDVSSVSSVGPLDEGVEMEVDGEGVEPAGGEPAGGDPAAES